MYNRHHDDILNYEAAYSSQINNANHDYHLSPDNAVKTLEISLQKAANVLIELYLPEGLGDAINPLDIQVATEQQLDLIGGKRNGYLVTSGDDQNDLLIGNDQANTLQGLGGSDILVGNGGGDTLIGGTGNDTFLGGEGIDIYVVNQGDGFDTVIDGDGQGHLYWSLTDIRGDGNTAADQWKKFSATTWQDQQNLQDTITYHLQTETNNTQTLYILRKGDVIKVLNWHSGDLGITLGDGARPESVNNTFLGDQRASMIGIEIDEQIRPDEPSYSNFKWSVVSWNTDGTLKYGVAEPDFDDVITGTVNKDRLVGQGGHDALDGGKGDDQLDGGNGNDLLGGGAGSDIVHGGIGSDVILTATSLAAPQRVNPHDNWLSFYDLPVSTLAWTLGGTWGVAISNDSTLTIYGGGSLILDNMADAAYGDAGDDLIVGGLGGDYLDGGADNDSMWGQAGADLIAGGPGDDKLWGDGFIDPGHYQTTPGDQHGSDLLDGGDGADWLYGGGGNDLLLGGTENDYLWGDDKNEDKLLGQYHGDDYLDGGVGDDILFGGGGDDTLVGGSGGDTLYGDDATANLTLRYHGDDRLNGGSGVDTLYGMGGSDTLDGGDEHDTLYGGDGNDLLTGGNGDDALYGGVGVDTYIVNAGGGIDTIVDPDKNSKIIFGAGIDSDGVRLHLGSLILDLGNGNAVHIDGFDPNDAFNSSAVSQFQFVDGSMLSSEQLLARGFDLDGTAENDTISGTNTTDRMRGFAGNDTLSGGVGDDTLDGGTGADCLEGGAGDDLYLNVSGEDVIRDTAGHNTIRLATATGLGVGGATLTTYGNENHYLRADIALNSGETLKIENAFFGTEATLVFSNGTQLDLESFIGTHLNTPLNLQAVDSGGKIYGGAGNDRIFGGSGNDIIVGGNGSDFLLGGAGDDSYMLGANSGVDRIVDIHGNNAIRFAAGITLADLDVKSGGAGLVLYIGGKESASITLGAESFRFVFADGQSLTLNELLLDSRHNAVSVSADVRDNVLYGSLAADSLNGGGGNDSLWGGRGNDNLSGGAGSDDYHYRMGDGLDVIDELGDSAFDQVSFGAGIQLADVSFNHRPNGDLTLDVAGTHDALTVKDWYNGSEQRVESFLFADGRSVTAATLAEMDVTPQRGGDDDDRLTGTAYPDVIQGGSGNDSLYSMDGNDKIYGETGDDVLDGGAGSDQLTGGSGADHYRLSMLSGIDQVTELADETSVIDITDYDVARLTGSRLGDDLRLGVRGAQDALLLKDFYTLAHHWLVRGEDGALSDLSTLLAANTVRRAELSEAAALAEDFYDGLHDNVLHAYRVLGFERQADDHWETPLQITVSRQVDSYLRADGYAGFIPSASTAYHLHGDFGFVSSRLSRADYSGNDASIVVTDDSSYPDGEANVQIRWSEPEGSEMSQTSYSYIGHYLYTINEAIEIMSSLGIGSLPNPYIYTESANYTHTQTLTAVSGIKVSSSAADGSGIKLAGTSAQAFFNISPLPTTLKVAVTTLNTAIHTIKGGDGDNAIHFEGDFAIVDAGSGNDTIHAHNYNLVLGSSGEGMLKGMALLNGGEGNDLIVAGYNDDYLIGGAGNDMLRGEHGEDRYYVFQDESGVDTIYDVSYGGDLEQDGVVFGAGINRADLSYSWGVEGLPSYTYGTYDESRVRTFQTLDIRWQTDSVARLVVSTPFVNNYGQVVERNDWEQTGIEYLEFADGGRLALAELIGSSQVPLRPELNRASTVSSGTADGDTLLGSSGADDLYGGAGDDILFGQAGDDWLNGGAGSDLLAGGSGNDLYYVFQDDSGFDSLYDFGAAGSDLGYGGTDIGYGGAVDADTVVFGWGIEPSNLEFSWDSVSLSPYNDDQFYLFQTLILRWRPDAGIQLAMPRDDDCGGPSAGVEIFRFVDGSQFTMAQLLTLAPPSPEHAPILNAAIEDQFATEDIDFTFRLPDDTFVDSDPGDVLQYSYSVVSDSDWLSFDPIARTFYGKPDVSAVGVTGVWITAKDHFGASAAAYFEITVDSIITFSGTTRDDLMIGTSGSDKLIGLTGSDMLIGEDGPDILLGGGGLDLLNGGDGNDTLDGGSGADTMVGGLGDDSYLVDVEGDSVVEDVDEGTDQVISKVSYTLAANVENLILNNTTAINGTGNTGNNIIVGGAGNNIIDGFVGADTLIGGLGNDTYVVDDAGDVVVEAAAEGNDLVKSWISFDLDWTTNIEKLTLLGSANLNAAGDAGANIITGNSGNNVLSGGAGVDKLVGGGGNDSYIVNLTVNGTLEDTIMAGNGIDTIRLQGSYAGAVKALTMAVTVENYDISATGTSLLNLTGNASNNVLTGNDANNLISGGAGDDVMIGALGDDIYTVDQVADSVVEANSAGNDKINSSVSFDLSTNGANVEQLILTGTVANNATGNAGDNLLIGNTAINSLFGNDGDDALYGMAGNDLLDGGKGNDVLIGGAGNDSLTGGADSDVFWFNSAANATSNVDTISDFVSGADALQFSVAVLAKLGVSGQFAAGDARFWSSATGLAHDADDRLIYSTATGELSYDSNGSAAGGTVTVAVLTGAPNLAVSDIWVV